MSHQNIRTTYSVHAHPVHVGNMSEMEEGQFWIVLIRGVASKLDFWKLLLQYYIKFIFVLFVKILVKFYENRFLRQIIKEGV